MREILDDLRRIVRGLRLTARHAERRLDVSGAQLFLLQLLRRRPARSIAELAARTFTDQSSASVVVTRLERRGLVARTRARDDRRRYQIALTPRGRALLRRAPAPAQSRLVEGLQAMPPHRLRALADGLRLLVQQTGLAGDRPALFFEQEHFEQDHG